MYLTTDGKWSIPPIACGVCGGNGVVRWTSFETYYVDGYTQVNKVSQQHWETCPNCNGAGTVPNGEVRYVVKEDGSACMSP